MINCKSAGHFNTEKYWTTKEIEEDFYFTAIDDAEFIIDENEWELQSCKIHYIQI